MNKMPRLLAVILDVTAVYIEEKDAHQYLFASSMTRREVIEKSVKTSGCDLWTTDEIEGFERGVIALGWSDWEGIARQFVTSRDNQQVRHQARGIDPEKKKQLLREHDAIPAFNESNELSPLGEIPMDACIESNEMPHLGDTTSMNDAGINNDPAIAYKFDCCVYNHNEIAPTTFDKPENEQIKIVEV